MRFKLALASVLMILGALVFTSQPSSTSADSQINPVYTSKYCNAMVGTFPDAQLQGNPLCTDNLTGGLNPGADLTTTVDFGPNDLNYWQIITFGPASGTNNAMPLAGQKIGGLESLTNLGVLNGACNQALVVDFVFYTVALPNDSGNPRASTNIIYPRNDGQTNRFGAWNVGSPPVNGGADNVNDTNSDLRADANEEAFANYPSYLLDMFDPDWLPTGDGPANPVIPKAVYGSLTNVVGNWIPLFFVQFDPGQLASIPGGTSKMTAAMGAPNVSVLNDPTSVVVSPSTITDFCTPLNVTTVLLGQVAGGGATRATNPASGTQFGMQYVASLRDLDQDGYENAIDTCPTQANTGNPRILNSGDTDGDGIDNVCDTSGLDNDEDADSFQNRQDNCPQVANGGNAQTDSEVNQAVGVASVDLGPKIDTMGDACDSGAVTFTQNGASNTVTRSSTVSNGRYHAKTNIVAKCFGATAAGGTDVDADGYCAANDNAESGGCAPHCAFRHTGWSGAAHPGLQMDTDMDFYSDTMETYLGTDPTKPCAQTSGTNNEAPLDNWPMDGNDSGTSNTIDVGQMLPLNPTVNVHPKGKRWDLNNDGIINTIDVGRFVAVLNKGCGSFAAPGGPTGIPAYTQQ